MAVLMAVLAAGLASSLGQAADPPIVLENDRVSLEIDPAFGAIARTLDKRSGMALAPAPGLAENFRLFLLLPGNRRATILGKDQRLSGVSRTPDALALSWTKPLRDTAGGEHRIAVRMDVKAAGNALEFRLYLDNQTAGKVKEVWYPMIGGLAGFGAPENLPTE